MGWCISAWPRVRRKCFKLVEDRLDDMLKAQRTAIDRRSPLPPARRGAVLLDPDVGDAELRTRLLSTVPEAQLREDQSDPGELDAGLTARRATSRPPSGTLG